MLKMCEKILCSFTDGSDIGNIKKSHKITHKLVQNMGFYKPFKYMELVQSCVVGGEENDIHAGKMENHCKIFGRQIFRTPKIFVLKGKILENTNCGFQWLLTVFGKVSQEGDEP